MRDGREREQWRQLAEAADRYTRMHGGRYRWSSSYRAQRAVERERRAQGKFVPKWRTRIVLGVLALRLVDVLRARYALAWVGVGLAILRVGIVAFITPYSYRYLLRAVYVSDHAGGQLCLVPLPGCVQLTGWSYWPRGTGERAQAAQMSAYELAYQVLVWAEQYQIVLLAAASDESLAEFYTLGGFIHPQMPCCRQFRSDRVFQHLTGGGPAGKLRLPGTPLPDRDAVRHYLEEHGRLAPSE